MRRAHKVVTLAPAKRGVFTSMQPLRVRAGTFNRPDPSIQRTRLTSMDHADHIARLFGRVPRFVYFEEHR